MNTVRLVECSGDGPCAGCGQQCFGTSGAVLLSTGRPVCWSCALRLVGATARHLAALDEVRAQARS